MKFSIKDFFIKFEQSIFENWYSFAVDLLAANVKLY